jgi:hypothetical protein
MKTHRRHVAIPLVLASVSPVTPAAIIPTVFGTGLAGQYSYVPMDQSDGYDGFRVWRRLLVHDHVRLDRVRGLHGVYRRRLGRRWCRPDPDRADGIASEDPRCDRGGSTGTRCCLVFGSALAILGWTRRKAV